MLELLLRPAFYVRGGAIEKVNQAAAGFLLQERMEILPLIATGKEEYKAFTEGCLYLSMELAGQTVEATVLSVEDYHLFVLEQSNTHSDYSDPELVKLVNDHVNSKELGGFKLSSVDIQLIGQRN